MQTFYYDRVDKYCQKFQLKCINECSYYNVLSVVVVREFSQENEKFNDCCADLGMF